MICDWRMVHICCVRLFFMSQASTCFISDFAEPSSNCKAALVSSNIAAFCCVDASSSGVALETPSMLRLYCSNVAAICTILTGNKDRRVICHAVAQCIGRWCVQQFNPLAQFAPLVQSGQTTVNFSLQLWSQSFVTNDLQPDAQVRCLAVCQGALISGMGTESCALVGK